MGVVVDKNHPIMKNVKTFDAGGDSWHIKARETERNSRIIAKYDDNEILIAEKQRKENMGRVVVLNINPISNKFYGSSGFWSPRTDGARIISNSIEYITNH
ncbi:hypothetical protein M0813_14459 [Anaeramoeba flamelloides]|nr:hypothetical protein M0813_14459 [Anaeramoeba flamelloides]